MLRRLGPDDYRVMPWKNGGGTTTELYAEPGPNGFLWRVSIADVAGDGPFSPFPDYDRHIMAIAGRGMVLCGGPDGDIAVAPLFTTRRFSGDWPITGRLIDGPVRDFNLIVRRSLAGAALDCVRFDAPMRLAGGGVCFLHMLSGSASVQTDLEACSLAPGDSLICDGPVVVSPLASGRPALVALCRIGNAIARPRPST
jgi:uncharacterized protein